MRPAASFAARARHIAWLVLVLVLVLPAAAPADDAPTLELPVDCAMDSLCTIQFYVDHDPSEAASDYRCGSLTYDGHIGTDIRLPDRLAMARGVAVLAAAEGVVLRVRDGEPDVSVDRRGQSALRGFLAGNAVVVGHAGDWETQYSHLERASIPVRPGQTVRAGDRLGTIGLSGSTNFPHLEFSVRRGSEPIDPFVGPDPKIDGCEVAGAPMWSARALARLEYRSSGVLLAGFSDRRPDRHAVRAGAHREPTIDATAPALVFWTDVYGIRAGDRYSLRLYDPDGRVVAEVARTSETDAAQRFDFAGRRAPEGGWPAGGYRGEYRLERTIDGAVRVVARATRAVMVR